MPYESVNSDHEEKEEDLLNSNHIINLNNLITNMDNFLVCKELSKERALQINLEENIYVENFIDYVEGYFQLTPSDEQKGVKELHEDFKKTHITVKQLLIMTHFAGISSSTEIF